MSREDAIDDLDASGVLAASGATRSARLAAQVRDLELVLAWADLHSSDPQAEPGAVPVRYGGDRLVLLGGDGTPRVQDLCVHELAIARQTHPAATRATIGDALDLRHRLPLTWAVVQDLGCEVWVATKVARMSRDLDRDRVGLVDAAVAQAIGGTAPGRVLALAEGKVVEADSAAHAARLEEERRRTGVWAGRTDTPSGTRTVVARVTPGDAAWVDGVLERIVDAFLARPDVLRDHHPDLPADIDDLSRQQLRAIAFGWLARPEDVRDLFAAAQEASVTVPRTARSGQRVVVYLHLHESAVLGASTAPARVEGLGPMLLEQVTRLVAHAEVVVKPVIDLEEHTAVDAYEFPAAVTERTRLRCVGDTFPHAVGTLTMSGRYDDDHPVPYDGNGPPGQTGDHNDAPLSRSHHRAKTHRGYRVRQLDDATYLWTSPHGLHRLVDPTGTHAVDDADAWRMTHADVILAALDRVSGQPPKAATETGSQASHSAIRPA
ncbi:hypothetical protein [Nocardioides sp.]|uniref:hypothetical protein n=1 Tax=Nocardioides sp. TaxID=35761 RepID=UPI0037838B24